MLGFKFISFDSMTYVLRYHNGKIVQEGRGLSFFYFAPTTSIAAIPMGSNSLPFIFSETTRDYQTVTVQGQITYKIANPRLPADQLDFTVDERGVYKKNDTEKLNQRIVNAAQTAVSSYLHELGLKEAIRAALSVESKILDGVSRAKSVTMLGVEILGANILAIKPSPETARALETETREKLQQEADEALFARRNFAVEQERKIRESELNTEIAVEEKKMQIAQKQTEADIQMAEKDRKLREMRVEADIAVEDQRAKLIEQQSQNNRLEAETQGYVLETTLKPYRELDWRILTALFNKGDAKTNIALAFRQLAENAGKIGQLNIGPDLLESLLNEKVRHEKQR